MRGMEEAFGMGAGASVRKGKTAKQVRNARKKINAAKKTTTKVSIKPEIRTNNTSGRKAYGGQKVLTPKQGLMDGKTYMQSADTREAVSKRMARNKREQQSSVVLGSKVPKGYKPNSNWKSKEKSRIQ